MINVAEVRELCADLADNGPGRSGAYELELRCKAARLLPAMLDEVERLKKLVDEAFLAGWHAGWGESGEGHNDEYCRVGAEYFKETPASGLAAWKKEHGL